ncbi:MAG: hypothetical protein GX683_01885 [Ruminococcaceae bacterium]|nr:hypothetical protein [Oscillospiraceae bacterium]
MNRNGDKSRLFLIEFICALVIFCITAAVCAGILSASYNRSRQSKAKDNAVLTVSSAIDLFKATGSAKDAAAELGGTLQGNETAVYYDALFTPCESEEDAFYTLKASFALDGRLASIKVSVSDKSGNDFYTSASSVILLSWEGDA